MKITNTHEAGSQLSRLLDRVTHGEEFVIERTGKPVARLIGYQGAVEPRRGGQWKGRVRISDDFDEPLPPDVAGPLEGR